MIKLERKNITGINHEQSASNPYILVIRYNLQESIVLDMKGAWVMLNRTEGELTIIKHNELVISYGEDKGHIMNDFQIVRRAAML